MQGSTSRSAAVRHFLRSNILGLIAIFIALAGTASALPGRNSVDSGDVKPNVIRAGDLAPDSVGASELRTGAVGNIDIADGGIHGPDISTGAIGGRQVDEAALGPVPAASFATAAGTADNAGNAAALGGLAPAAFARGANALIDSTTASYGVSTGTQEGPEDLISVPDFGRFIARCRDSAQSEPSGDGFLAVGFRNDTTSPAELTTTLTSVEDGSLVADPAEIRSGNVAAGGTTILAETDGEIEGTDFTGTMVVGNPAFGEKVATAQFAGTVEDLPAGAGTRCTLSLQVVAKTG